MSPTVDTTYRFTTAAHWEAGARENLELVDGSLRVPARLCLEPVEGLEAADAGAMLAYGPCRHLNMLRPRSRRLIRRYPSGPAEVGVINGNGTVTGLAVGSTVMWLLSGGTLERHAYAHRQLLGTVEVPPEQEIRAITSDGGDGLWVLERASDGPARLRHIDCWGRTCCPPVDLGDTVAGPVALAATADGKQVVVLDAGDRPQLVVIDVCDGGVLRAWALDESTRSVAVAIGPDDRIRLLGQATEGRPTLVLETWLLTGELEDRQSLDPPARFGTVRDVALGDRLVISGTGGVVELVPCDDGIGERISTFITPSLVSPLAVASGWNRAEVDVELTEGTTLEVTSASTSDPGLIAVIDALFGDEDLLPFERFRRLDSTLPWDQGSAVRYESVAGTGLDRSGTERLPVLLDRVDDTHLWLRITLRTPPGRTPPTLSGLRVLYPERSLIDDLPAVYRQDELSASQLRRMLAPFEVLLEGLDETLEGLPARIHPETAPESWTSFLLRWLGFPPLDDLDGSTRSKLLKAAPSLLYGRGTVEALQQVLDIVTGERATVDDRADGAVGWFLPSEHGSAGARLGIDTLAAGQQPAPSRAGGLALGETPLGRGCSDPALVLAQRARVVAVRIDAGPDQRRRLEPIIGRLLSVFVPAHCRLEVSYSGLDDRRRTRRLDIDFRLPAEGAVSDDGQLYSDTHWQLGANTRLATWPLSLPSFRPAVLDHNVHLEAHVLDRHPTLN